VKAIWGALIGAGAVLAAVAGSFLLPVLASWLEKYIGEVGIVVIILVAFGAVVGALAGLQ
jgi:hypothetical protein